MTVYFHAQTLEQRDQWEHLVTDKSGSDEGMRFFCYFTAIDELQLDLADSQGIFLGLLGIKPTEKQG